MIYSTCLHFYGYAATVAARFSTYVPAVTEARSIAAKNAGLPDTARFTEKRRNDTAGKKKADNGIAKQKKEEGKDQSLLRLLKKQ